MWWTNSQLEALDAALDAPLSVSARVFVVQGDRGQGKTALLHELVIRAAKSERKYRVIQVAGQDAGGGPTLRLLTLVGGTVPVGPTPTAFEAGQWLREALTDRDNKTDDETGRPLLLVVDDLDAVDPLSVDALMAFLERIDGNELVLACARRPPELEEQESWQRLLHTNEATTVRLEGLAKTETELLIRSLEPDASQELVHRVWEHTQGNPLYIRALFVEQHLDEL
jgi:predicted ATPase